MAPLDKGKGKAGLDAEYLPIQEAPPPPPPLSEQRRKQASRRQTEEQKTDDHDPEDDEPLPQRPSTGKEGQSTQLDANYFAIDLGKTDAIYVYSLSFLRGYDPGSKRRERRVLQLLLDQYPACKSAATDYRERLVSIKQLTEKNLPRTLEVFYHEIGDTPVHGADALKYYVTVSYLKKLELGSLHDYLGGSSSGSQYTAKDETVAALNLLLGRHTNQSTHVSKIGRGRVFDQRTTQPLRAPLRGGLEAAVGFEKSVRIARAGLLLNLNAATSAFYVPLRMDELIKQWTDEACPRNYRENKNAWQVQHLVKLERFLKGLQVRATYAPRRFHSVWGIARASNGSNRPIPDQVMFDLEKKDEHGNAISSESITVFEYFRRKHGIRTATDCLVVDVGSQDRSIFIPANLLDVLPGNFYRHVLLGAQQSTMIQFACRPARIANSPTPNHGLITNSGVPMLGIRAQRPLNGPYDGFGFNVDLHMLRIDGRYLTAPVLQYRQYNAGGPVENRTKILLSDATKHGAWKIHDCALALSAKRHNWSWIEFTKGPPCDEVQRQVFLNAIEDGYKRYCSFDNIEPWDHPDGLSSHILPYPDGKLEEQKKTLQEFLNKFKVNVDFLFVILPEKSIPQYAMLKLVADTLVGIQTTCVVKEPQWEKEEEGTQGQPSTSERGNQTSNQGNNPRGRQQGYQQRSRPGQQHRGRPHQGHPHQGHQHQGRPYRGSPHQGRPHQGSRQGDQQLTIKEQARAYRGKTQIKCKPEVIANIMQKVNVRLRGTNTVLANAKDPKLFTPETMVVGADVTHPGVGSLDKCPSIAAVVCSTYTSFSHYTASLRCQGSKVERIEKFTEMLVERLEYWKAKSGAKSGGKSGAKYPERLVIFRDGVSEGQFQMILKQEWPQIQKACRETYAKAKQQFPKILLMCVLKRHATRFFPRSEDDRDVLGNPKCGLVVDQGVTYKDGYDFYLQSHAVIKGTARPAHYVVLVDELNLAPDIVQRETYQHCFLYGRCNRAIGIHPAARLADRACDRGRKYLQHVFSPENDRQRTFDRATPEDRGAWIQDVHDDLKNEMFFL
ncbi:hypothetical protein EPUS_08438 [Endocarpon pusillum Z07020]|uniref:Piwi domain-containing protein n=1 Tax=Endocarpon pusillum (strain Z07020 / HMAS-L-300199) TaxID=1263415 RepID=U1GSZ4_ENDPU|nr:uncharacterized protein EPUS_08438 [Endocarpon pusillum Z07020]ERF75533.1 hypothetical protein EPUS_08438 [Endocarpon pusillum Z07020]